MRWWKPFERWTEVLGNRVEHLWHADFELQDDDVLIVRIGRTGGHDTVSHVIESPPPGKIYRAHIKIALEEFDQE